jgi:hypothetical protein
MDIQILKTGMGSVLQGGIEHIATVDCGIQ